MKNLLFLFLFTASSPVMASMADTSAYQTQRLKVNALLKQRSAKFGQYDLSLDTKTGIFGMQTKDDIKNSNEILRQIVITDNNVFKELKILMDYKDQELLQVQTEAKRISENTEHQKTTIKKLQDENQELKSQLDGQHLGGNLAWYIVVLLGISLIITIIQLKKKPKTI